VTVPAGHTAVITGAGGQLGQELVVTVPSGWMALPYTSAELDITRPEAVADVLGQERPAVVINAAAYTEVDAAERDPKRAEAVNTLGAANLAGECRRVGARLIHLSTDYVFDGAQSRPYLPGDPPHPLNVYGRTKLAGEREVARLAAGDAVILRSAWLYSGQGRNFVLTMLGVMKNQEQVGVVCDQFGTPTWCRSLAEAVWAAAQRPQLAGLYHWTDAGVTSWHEFAVAIQQEALALGLLERAVPIRPIRGEDRPSAAQRPRYSALDATSTSAALGLQRRAWRVNLQLMLRGLVRA
jgi:dTDP-4-dehydrorhamnose reductase